MLTPEEIAQSFQEKEESFRQRRHSVSIIKTIIDDAKSFFNSLTDKIVSIKDGVFKVNVENQIELPEVQKIEGKVDVDFRNLVVGLNEVIRSLESVKKEIKDKKYPEPEKVKFDSVVKAIQSLKFPETKIPEFPKEITVGNLSDLKKYFDSLKLQVNVPETKIPPFPKEIKVSNLPEPEKKEEAMIGFYWNKNENGDLTELVEQYPSGEVISKGWAIGRVTINDKRN